MTLDMVFIGPITDPEGVVTSFSRNDESNGYPLTTLNLLEHADEQEHQRAH